jgi:hypothetical protein
LRFDAPAGIYSKFAFGSKAIKKRINQPNSASDQLTKIRRKRPLNSGSGQEQYMKNDSR